MMTLHPSRYQFHLTDQMPLPTYREIFCHYKSRSICYWN